MDEIVAQVRPDVIFHVAAQRSPALAEVDVHRTVTTNVLGARNVLTAAAAAGGAPGGVRAVVRLHGSSVAFYAPCALESAQLLLLACLGARPGEFRVHSITDLGWPVSLIDVALGVLSSRRSRTPVYISGYDPGYEEVPLPGLYDPATAGDVSPLLNAFEAATLVDSPCPMVDAFKLETAEDSVNPKLLAALDCACGRTRDAAPVRAALDELSWSLLDAALGAAARTALDRSARLICQHQATMTPEHRRIAEAIRSHASPANT